MKFSFPLFVCRFILYNRVHRNRVKGMMKMADFMTHDLLGEQALAVFPAAAQRAAALHPAVFRWGLQGPDPLFFHKVYAGSPLHKLGNRLHEERTDALFTVFAESVNRLTDENHDIASAYFYGFLCHYALDSTIHPYVYYQEHECIRAMPGENASAIHCQIETDIDCALYDRCKGDHLHLPTAAYQMNDQETAVVSVILHHLIRCVLRVDVPTSELRPAFAEMLACQRLFYQGGRGLSRPARKVERLLGKGPLLTSHIKTGLPQWDALNESHSPWRNLWNPDVVCTESVTQLFELAKDKAAELASSYAAQFDSGWMLNLSYYEPFDNGNYRRQKP